MQITTKGGKKGIPEVFQRWNNKNICYFYDIITYMVICQLSKMCNFWNVICFPSLRKLLPKFALIVLCPGSAPVLEFHPSPSPGPHGRRLNKARAVRTQRPGQGLEPAHGRAWLTDSWTDLCFRDQLLPGWLGWFLALLTLNPHSGDLAPILMFQQGLS